MAVCALLGLIFRLKLAYLLMQPMIKLGAIFTALALISGSFWGKPMWGTWWIWDARLTSELVLLFIYLGVMLFQSATAHKRSGEQLTAILVLIGFFDIPLIHYSVTWWNTLHQGATLQVFAPPKIASSMLYPLIAMLVAFCAYAAMVIILQIRYRLIVEQSRLNWLKNTS